MTAPLFLNCDMGEALFLVTLHETVPKYQNGAKFENIIGRRNKIENHTELQDKIIFTLG